jgi:putative ABC transport system permease protein
MLSDIRFAARTLLRSPGFTIAAALTIAIGVGANATMFGVVDAVMLRALPFREPERVVALYEVTTDGNDRMPISPANFRDWTERTRSFSGMAALYTGQATLDGDADTGAEPERIAVARTSGNLAQVLGVSPMLGRPYTADDAAPGRPAVVMLGHRAWVRRFGADSSIVGKAIRLDGMPYTVVGVLPPDVRWPESATAAWLPNTNGQGFWEQRGNHSLSVVARLAPGVTMAQAQAELQRVAAGVNAEHPEMHRGWSARHVPILEATVGNARQVLLVLLGAVSFVLLIGCANVTNLALARAAARQRDVAVRAAMGARTTHLLRLYFGESVVLGALGGGLGIVIAILAMAAIPHIAPAEILRLDTAHVDWRVGGFALVLAVVASFVSAAWPSLIAARGSVATTMREGGRSATAGKARARGRDVLFVAEVALSLMLLVGAGLAVRSVVGLLSTNPGFRPERVLTAALSLPRVRYGSDTAQSAFIDAVLANARAQSGVRGAGYTTSLPLGGEGSYYAFWVEGRPDLDGPKVPLADGMAVSEGYFDTMGIPLSRGRDFVPGDGVGTPKVAIVNERLAKKIFPEQDPIGRNLMPWGTEGPKFQIVGVVGDVKQESLTGEDRMQLYMSARQVPSRSGALVVRGAGNPAMLAATLRQAVRTTDAQIAVNAIRTMRDVVSESVARPRFAALLLGTFATCALLLAMVGIYGVVSHGVSQRQGEFGIRSALGARPADLLRDVLGGALGRTGAGLALGVVGSLALTRVVGAQLPGVRGFDPLVLATVALLLGSVALVASWVPARRATRASPLSALRAE